ncbi:NUDIX hydrolase [Commensalibacter nepenthis]|uniref:NUDIX hydrolase n=1 Tax=Commensalibacter nepenthis TaxID=3043872 RepID=A0ABT6Q6B9_9PROT|nr:NUDIX hydrolase [Commensalibacter sp. TBRC 10068]MDI2111885.1 NUDIX hydrolase [Commensalibacter sp. TBRC 10068]
MEWETILLDSALTVNIIPAPQILSASLKKEVNDIWEEKKKYYPNLFNGRIFNVQALSKNLITGFWTEYKFVLAQTEKPELYSELAIRSLAVIGLIRCPQGFLIGKRAANSVYLPGYWQSPPAGTVESRDGNNDVILTQQLYAEANEELGLNTHHLINPKIISATEHTDTHIIDIGILLKTNLSFIQILELWKKNNNSEYDELCCCAHYTDLPENTLPTTRFLIQHWSD